MLGCSCSFGRRGGEGRGRSITGSFLIFFFSFSARQGDKYIPSNLAIEQALTSQQTFTCEMWNVFEINNKDTKNDLIEVVLLSLLLTLNIFHTFSSVSIVHFEQIKFAGIAIELKQLLTCVPKASCSRSFGKYSRRKQH